MVSNISLSMVHTFTEVTLLVQLAILKSITLPALLVVLFAMLSNVLLLLLITVIYELDPNNASGALPTAFFTHPNTSWVWSSISEGPSAIYVSGYDPNGTSSSVFKILLDITNANYIRVSQSLKHLQLLLIYQRVSASMTLMYTLVPMQY